MARIDTLSNFNTPRGIFPTNRNPVEQAPGVPRQRTPIFGAPGACPTRRSMQLGQKPVSEANALYSVMIRI